jgi:DNA-binding CsgD family transcriptional regulator
MLIPHSGHAFEYFVERTAGLMSKERLFELYVDAMRNYGFDHLNFSVIRDRQLPQTEHGFGLISTYREDWRKFYVERRFANIDPVLKSASALVQPFTWKGLIKRQVLTPKQVRFLSLAEEAQLCNGIGIPFNGATSQIAGIALATSSPSTDHLHNTDLLSAFANQFYVVFKRIVGASDRLQPSTSPLTARETQVLQLMARGATDEQIAERLFISYNTAAFFAKTIYRKLNASNRVQAIVIGLASGIIEL